MIFTQLLDALKAGKELRNAATWILALLVAVGPRFGMNIPVSESDLATIATGLGTLLFGLVNVYLTVATTKKLGVIG
jgi:hypothetical protein